MSSVKAGEVICAARGETTYLLFSLSSYRVLCNGEKGACFQEGKQREREINHKNIPQGFLKQHVRRWKDLNSWSNCIVFVYLPACLYLTAAANKLTSFDTIELFATSSLAAGRPMIRVRMHAIYY